MKRITLLICSLLILATTALFTGCGDGSGIVELTTAAQEVNIFTSSGAMTIDWGDGQVDTYTSTTDSTKITHTYADNHSHTIKMNADRLIVLFCFDNQLTALDVSRNTALLVLWCSDNQLTAVDVSLNTALELLYCSNNQLTTLNVSKNKTLRRLKGCNNQLTTLDVSRNTALVELWCENNQLTALDMTKNTALVELICSNNQLTTLDVSRNTALTGLVCFNNQLTTLDVSRNKALILLGCGNNQLTEEALNALLSGLPHPPDGLIYIEDNPGSSTCNRSIATEKGWSLR